MATFQVPQFIDQKAKIVGFLTLPQFIYLASGGGIIFITFKIFSFFFFLLIAIIVGALAISLAFVKINGQEMPKVLLAGISYLWNPRIYTWKRDFKEKEIDSSEIDRLTAVRNNMSIQKKIQSIALSVSTGKIFSTKQKQQKSKKNYEVVTYLTGEKRVAKRVNY